MIRDAEERDYPAVAGLMRAFVDWQQERHADHRAMIDSYFDEARFEAELASLPGAYGPPAGALLVADIGGRIAGCIALQRLDDERCEMKRLFLDPAAHGRGIGKALVNALVDRARTLGYAKMMLNTGPLQVEAQRLYRACGFREAEPYGEMTDALRDWLIFMERDLGTRI